MSKYFKYLSKTVCLLMLDTGWSGNSHKNWNLTKSLTYFANLWNFARNISQNFANKVLQRNFANDMITRFCTMQSNIFSTKTSVLHYNFIHIYIYIYIHILHIHVDIHLHKKFCLHGNVTNFIDKFNKIWNKNIMKILLNFTYEIFRDNPS